MADQNNKIEIIQGDITKIEVDAIVNAANRSLLGGGGVDGAIHRASGPKLLEACRPLNGCETGEARVTRGYLLPARFVIHTVGPVWHGGTNDEENLLRNCYRNSLLLAHKLQITTIAFPNISTGIYHFPKELAASIAIDEVTRFLKQESSIQKVIFVCFDNENFEIYQQLL